MSANAIKWLMDWKKLIADLTGIGWSQARIGKKLNRPQSWVADVLSGRYLDIKWTDGQALIRLHRAEMRRRSKKESAHA